MAKDVLSNHRTNTWIIIVLALMFVSVIYLPKTIWDREAATADESHFRMNAITQAERLYYIISQSYTNDPIRLETMVNGVLDSVRAAAQDTLGPYAGYQDVIIPGKSISVRYDDAYRANYLKLHEELARELHPSHFATPEQIAWVMDTVETQYLKGGYLGEQHITLDSVDMQMVVPDKYDIMYQNVKTLMFNQLTSSFTPDPAFSNPLVDAVLDTIEKNPDLRGQVDFSGLYTDPIEFAFLVPSKFPELVENSKLKFKAHLLIDPIDSTAFGDTLYDMALEEFLAMDTSETLPGYFEIEYTDTSGVSTTIPVEVDRENMLGAKNEARNTLYKALTGYNEPGRFVSDAIIAMAEDSLAAGADIADSFHVDLDLSKAVFTIRIHPNIPAYHHKIARETAYLKLGLNRSDIPLDSAAVEILDFVADTLQNRGEFMGWQVVPTHFDTFYVEVNENFLRHYDNMNMALYQQLTGEYNNVHGFVEDVVGRVEALAAIDSLQFTGQQVLEIPPDTVRIYVPDDYQTIYDSTFVTYRDTVVQVDDSTFTGVWSRGKIAVTDAGDLDSLFFLLDMGSGAYHYSVDLADSVREINIAEKTDTSQVEKAFWNANQYIVTFTEDSLTESVYRIVDAFEMTDSLVIDSLNVISPEFVVGSEEKEFLARKDSFAGWQDTLIAKKYAKRLLVASYPFRKEYLICPVTGIPYRITVRNKVNLTVESPIEHPIRSRRYLFFTQVDSSHGRIVDGEASWNK